MYLVDKNGGKTTLQEGDIISYAVGHHTVCFTRDNDHLCLCSNQNQNALLSNDHEFLLLGDEAVFECMVMIIEAVTGLTAKRIENLPNPDELIAYEFEAGYLL